VEPDPLLAELATWLRIVRYAVLGVVVLTVLFFGYHMRDVFIPSPPPTAAELREQQDGRCALVTYLRETSQVAESLSKDVCP
jgi:hypothetical protein